MLKELLKLKNGKDLDIKYPIKIFDSNGNVKYYENSNNFWYKIECDSSGNVTWYEENNGFWYKKEYDSNGNETYYEDSFGNTSGNSKAGAKQKIKELEEKLAELKKEIEC